MGSLEEEFRVLVSNIIPTNEQQAKWIVQTAEMLLQENPQLEAILHEKQIRLTCQMTGLEFTLEVYKNGSKVPFCEHNLNDICIKLSRRCMYAD